MLAFCSVVSRGKSDSHIPQIAGTNPAPLPDTRLANGITNQYRASHMIMPAMGGRNLESLASDVSEHGKPQNQRRPKFGQDDRRP